MLPQYTERFRNMALTKTPDERHYLRRDRLELLFCGVAEDTLTLSRESRHKVKFA